GGDDFDPSERLIGTLGHSRTHRRMPMPYRLCRLSGQNGVRSTMEQLELRLMATLDGLIGAMRRVPCLT
ncbi:MAG: hypothetical protein KME20_28445, partial [Kaiparowitsia implicata GSE-PSE-MK54-09C]|nr:hypothetical protein [Kaiparowitsia implicata GSE-PSE-MK54-09C]